MTSLHCGHWGCLNPQSVLTSWSAEHQASLPPSQASRPHHTVRLAQVSWVSLWRFAISTLKGCHLPHTVFTRVCWLTLLITATQNLTSASQLLESQSSLQSRRQASQPPVQALPQLPFSVVLSNPLTFKGHLKLIFIGCVVSMGTLKKIC